MSNVGLKLREKWDIITQLDVKISNFGHLELKRAPELVEVSDAVDTAIRRLYFLKFGIATQTY